jgi:hypothetical protein
VKDRAPGDDLRTAVGEVMNVFKVCVGTEAQFSSFDTKIVVSAKPKEHELIAATLASLYAAGPSTQSVREKERADAIGRAKQLWKEKYERRVLMVGGQTNYEAVRQEFEAEVDAMKLGIKGSDVPTRNPASAPDGTKVADMTVDDMALVDSQIAKDLSIKHEIEVALEQTKRDGSGPGNARRKMIEQMLEVRTKMVEDRAKWFREKYKDLYLRGDKMVPASEAAK